MPFSEGKFPPVEAASEKIESQPSVPDVSRMNAKELEGYKVWKGSVPSEIRSMVEGQLLGKKVRMDTDGLPSVVEFYRAMQVALQHPRVSGDELVADEIVKKQMAALQNIRVGELNVNLFSVLADANVGFEVKANYVVTKLLPRLEFLRARDGRLAQSSAEASDTDVSGEDEEEEYSPHRSPKQESEGLPDEAIATMNPFFGGYVMDAVYAQYDSDTHTWKPSERRFQKLATQTLDDERTRVYRSKVKNGRGPVKLPRGWGVDGVSVTWDGKEPASWTLEADTNGIVRVKTQEDVSVGFTAKIAPTKDALPLAPPEGEVPDVPDRFPAELLAQADEVMKATVSTKVKTRRIASIIHKYLEYDQDIKWEGVYKADPSKYFEKIWEHKKAKCDEANTLLVRLLTKLGVHARFAGGHSVRQKSPAGEALLLESNRHAWAFAWDEQAREWIRLDATPAGDPNIDQDQQQEELGEGDYSEQEAELMSEEELEKRLEEAQREEEEERERRETDDPILSYAKEAECSPEEAREVLQKIQTVRNKYARVLAQADKQWQTLVRTNIRARVVDRGPVPMSQMDEIDPDELVSGSIEMAAGEKDPLIGQREEVEQTKEKWFGGYEVYVMADLSGSMANHVNGVQKSKSQRDMVFLLVDSIMSAGVIAKQADQRLKAPMPAKISLTVFGKEIEIALPLTGQWTPKEQLKLYRALDVNAGGGTPDHTALELIESQIVRAQKEEESARKAKPAKKKHGWKMRRFVVAVADGDSDRPATTKAANARLREAGVTVDLLLIADENDTRLKQAAQGVYQSVIPVPDVGDLAEKGLTVLAQRIKEAYGGNV